MWFWILMIPLALCDAVMLLLYALMILGNRKGHDGQDRDL